MTENKKPVLVGAAAWILILLGGYHVARAAYGNFALAVMLDSPSVLLGLATSTMPVETPPLARLLVENTRLVFAFYFFISLAMFVTGLGLLLRKAWGVSAFKWLCYIGGASGFIILLFPGLIVPKPYVFGGVALTPEFNAAVTRMKFQLRLAAALFGAAAFWIGRRFERPDIMAEFAGIKRASAPPAAMPGGGSGE